MKYGTYLKGSYYLCGVSFGMSGYRNIFVDTQTNECGIEFCMELNVRSCVRVCARAGEIKITKSKARVVARVT